MVKDTVDPPKNYTDNTDLKEADGGITANIRGEETFIPHPSPDKATNERDVQCNLSALLILIVEQHAMLSEMLSLMMEAGAITEAGLVKVTAARTNTDITTPLYEDYYKRFTDLFFRTKWYLLSEEEKKEYLTKAENFGFNLTEKEKKDE